MRHSFEPEGDLRAFVKNELGRIRYYGGGKGSAPPAPDYTGAAQATGLSGQQNTLLQSALNNPNISTPYGSIGFSNPGYQAYQDALKTNPNANPSQYISPGSTTASLSLSPQEQQILNQQQQTQIGLGGLEGGQLGAVGNALKSPGIDLNGLPSFGSIANSGTQGVQNQIVNSLYNQQTQYLDPQFQQIGDQLHTQLANEGLGGIDPKTGQPSAAANVANQNLGLQRQQAYSNAMDNAIGQGIQGGQAASSENLAALQAGVNTQQQQQLLPLNELSALMSGSQVTMPGQIPTSGVSAPPATDYSGAAGNTYASQLGNYNAGQAGMGQLLNLGGTLGAAYLMS